MIIREYSWHKCLNLIIVTGRSWRLVRDKPVACELLHVTHTGNRSISHKSPPSPCYTHATGLSLTSRQLLHVTHRQQVYLSQVANFSMLHTGNRSISHKSLTSPCYTQATGISLTSHQLLHVTHRQQVYLSQVTCNMEKLVTCERYTCCLCVTWRS